MIFYHRLATELFKLRRGISDFLEVPLNIFQKIIDNGRKVDGKSELDGVVASTSYDGYTVFLADSKVTIHLFFHNTRQTDFTSRRDLESFYKKLQRIEQNY